TPRTAPSHPRGRLPAYARVRDLHGVSARAKRGDRVLRGAEPDAHLRAERSHVGAERVYQDAVPGEHVAFRLRALELGSADDQGLRVGVLEVLDALDHRLDLRLDVVRLVDGEPDAALEGAGDDELVKDEKELEGRDRADDEVVVPVLAVVEVEAAKPTRV